MPLLRRRRTQHNAARNTTRACAPGHTSPRTIKTGACLQSRGLASDADGLEEPLGDLHIPVRAHQQDNDAGGPLEGAQRLRQLEHRRFGLGVRFNRVPSEPPWQHAHPQHRKRDPEQHAARRVQCTACGDADAGAAHDHEEKDVGQLDGRCERALVVAEAREARAAVARDGEHVVQVEQRFLFEREKEDGANEVRGGVEDEPHVRVPRRARPAVFERAPERDHSGGVEKEEGRRDDDGRAEFE
mmetsp:Transcript_60251/g.138247  ORF Transcript_60251/g.138247 Transcript_60251/m.138247 type:complete len:243 (+) Transcript_60251:256-984(+)